MGAFPVELDVLPVGTPQAESSDSFDVLPITPTEQQAAAHEMDVLPAPPAPGYMQLLSEGVQRNWAQLQAAPNTIGAIADELTGDTEGMQRNMAAAAEIERRAPAARWELKNVNGVEDFSYWLTERFGENALTLLTSAAGGGAGALVGKMAARSIAAGAASRRALMMGGSTVGAFATAAPIEAAATAQEQHGVLHDSTNPYTSLSAGAIKGLLEIYTPLRIGRALVSPGAQLGRTIPRAIASTAIGEGATEAAQEGIDIYLRQAVDPNYQFYDPSQPLNMGEGAWRMAEATLAGTMIGGIVGTPPAVIDVNQQRKGGVDDSGMRPGQREVISDTEIAPTGEGPGVQTASIRTQQSRVPQATPQLEAASPQQEYDVLPAGFAVAPPVQPETPEPFTGQPGPVTELRNMILPREDIDRSIEQSTIPNPREDLLVAGPLLRAGMQPENLNAWVDLIEAKTERYAVELPNGNRMESFLNATDVEYWGAISTQHQGVKPKLFKVDQSSLVPAAITADPLDLPTDVNSKRLWFLPGTSEVEKQALRAFYAPIAARILRTERYALIDASNREQTRKSMRALIGPLYAKGLRVIPSRGSSFDYVGGFDSKEVDPISVTQRSQQIMMLSPNGELTTGAHKGEEFSTEFAFGPPGSVPVALDMAKFKPGDISRLPTRLPDGRLTTNMWVVPGHEFGKGQYFDELTRLDVLVESWVPERGNLWTAENLKKFRGLMKQGYYIPPNSEYWNIITKEPVTVDKLIPGVNKAEFGLYHTSIDSVDDARGITRPNTRENTVYMDSGQFLGASEQVKETATKMREIIAKYLPIYDRLLPKLGMDNFYDVEIITFDPKFAEAGAWIQVQAGLIKFPAQTWAPQRDNPHFELGVYETLAHEIGHGITYHFFNKLSTEQKQQLEYAYQKALLARRVAPAIGDAKLSAPGIAVGPQNNVDYFSTFSEWLAEQFRRFAVSDTEIRSELDRTSANIGAKLEQYYSAVEEGYGKLIADNLQNPDYFFSAFMEYLRNFGAEKERMKQLERQQTLYAIGDDILASPALLAIQKQVMAALQSMQAMIPNSEFQAFFGASLDQNLAPAELDAIARAIRLPNKVVMELAVGSLKLESALADSRVMIAHELIHAYRMLGIISKEDLNFLYTMAMREGKALSALQKSQIRSAVKAEVGLETVERDERFDAEVELRYQLVLREETVAYYVGDYANSGVALEQAKPLLNRILEVIERIKNYMNGLGYRSRDDVLETFFRGEMLERGERQQRKQAVEQRFMKAVSEVDAERWMDTFESEHLMPDGTTVRVGTIAEGDKIYQFWHSGMVLGTLSVEGNDRGLTVEMIRSNVPGFAQKMIEHVEALSGQRFLASKMLLPAGFRAISRVRPDLARNYVFDKMLNVYWSPRAIMENHDMWVRIDGGIKRSEKQGKMHDLQQKLLVKENVQKWKGLQDKLGPEFWANSKQILEQLFMVKRNFNRDGVNASMIRSGERAQVAELEQLLGGSPSPEQMLEPFKQSVIEGMNASQRTAAQKAGIDYNLAAPQMPEVRNMRKVLEALDFRGYKTSEENTKRLMKTSPEVLINQEADRIGFFTRTYWGLRQLIWRNEHISGLVGYGQNAEQMQAMLSRWLRDADDIARVWEGKEFVTPDRREKFSEFMFWLSEMEYLSDFEKKNEISRHPTQDEYTLHAKALGMTPKELDFISTYLYQLPANALPRAPKDIFGRFLDELEQISIDNIIDTVTGADAQTKAIIELKAEMQQYRDKPYFPIARFGQHTITVRDTVVDAEGKEKEKVVAFYAFERHWERDSAIKEVHAKYPYAKILKGRVPEEMFEFMSLPGPLIRQIRDKMPELTPEQQAWLEDFEKINFPDRSFRKRWTPKVGTAGFSMDAFRTFAHYFMHGSRYMSRLKYGKLLSKNIAEVRASIDQLPNSAKRRMIVDYMTKHYNYLMEGGKDWAKFKSFVAIWQLGFSPAAAFMNLTQTPMVTLPWLSGTFGQRQGTSQLLSSLRAVRSLRNGTVTKGTGNYKVAREEAIRQGRIDIGQAAELGAFAEGHNLLGLLAGTRGQRVWRDLSYYSMWMFSKAEQANREITFHATWELAKKNPKNKRLQDIELKYQGEIADLMSRIPGFSQEDAAAFIMSKEALDQTQGLYAPYARPAFMRSPLAGTLLIFYQFIQMMTYAFRFNPGMVQMWLMMTFLYGLSGIPGSDDLNEILKLLGKKIFGKDWDVQMHARKYARELTRGSIMDETGPDLLLHGISRYGFGLGLLPEGYALGKFDASANGSMGKLVPGLYEALHSINSKAKPEQFVSDVTSRLAGAGFGMFFNLAQFGMEGQGSVDSHKWESMLPRAVRATAKAYRLAPPELGLPQVGPLKSQGAETNRAGARLVKFDVSDPEDLAAVLTQALGFSPTKVSSMWEQQRIQREVLQVYQARRTALYAQLDAALQRRSTEAQQTVIAAIREYNSEVTRDGVPSLSINAQQLTTSLQQRIRTRQLQELGLPGQRSQIPVARKVQDLFPNVKAERVR